MGRKLGKFAWIAACVAALMATASPVRAQSTDEFGGVTRERIVADMDRQIRRHFAHWQGVPDLNYDEAFAAYRTAALAAPDRRSFSLLSEAFVARLNNGHTFFRDPRGISNGENVNIPFSVQHYDGQWIVTGSLLSAVPSGSVLSALDDEPFEALYQRHASELAASSDRARRSLFSWPRGYPAQFTAHLADGRAVRVDRTTRPDLSFPEIPQTVFARWQSEGVAYLRVRSFNSRDHESAAVALMRGEYINARTVIVDVRANGGGNTPNNLGRLLLGRDWRFWQTSAPRAPVTATQRTRPTAPKYIVLIDRYCASACEDFVMPFSISAQAVLVGEATMGTSGQPEITRWDNGMQLWVGRRRQWFPNDGREFEGVGVGPDVPITLRATDFVKDAPDRILACAVVLAQTASAECPA